MQTMKGVMIAGVAAGLVLSGAVTARAQSATGGEVFCAGINECRGQGACRGANHCEGRNECKAKGVIQVSPAECAEKGGKVVAEGGED